MRFRILKFLAIALLATLAIAQAETIEIQGQVSSKEGDTLKISYEGDQAPKVGDPVSITTEIAGRTLDGGKAEVTEVSDGFIHAKILSGRPNVRMKAVIESELKVPETPESLYAQGFEFFQKTLPADANPFEWNTKADTQSPDYATAFEYLKEAATLGHADAQYLCAIDERYGSGASRGSNRNAWLKQAADSGSADAQFILSRAHYLGLYGERKDQDLSLDYLTRAADQKHPRAVAELERRQALIVDEPQAIASSSDSIEPPIRRNASIQDEPTHSGPDVLFFEHASMQGEAVGYFAGNAIPSLERAGMKGRNWNDAFSSIDIQGNVDVYLYEHANFQGRRIHVSRPVVNLGSVMAENGRFENWNDRVSSLKIEPRATAGPGMGGQASQVYATIFSDANFVGDAMELLSSENYPNLKDLRRGRRNWNDTISSIEVADGFVLELYSDANFKGEVIRIDAGQSNLDRIRTIDGRTLRWNDAISSIRIAPRH